MTGRGKATPALSAEQPEARVVETDLAIASGLRKHVLQGLKWNAVIVITNQVARMITSLVLVRLLSPHDYGLAGMALVFSGLVFAFSDLGLGAGLVQRGSITERDRSTVFWTSVAVGIVMVGSGIAISGVVASFFHQPRVRLLFIAVSISFIFPALQTAPASLLQRSMNFRAISIRSVGANLGASIVGITGALLGWGAWALIAFQLTTGFLSTLILWITARWWPRLTYSRESLRTLGGFGLKLLGARSLDYVQGNADNILVGRFLGSTPLGLYAVAYNVILLPVQRLFVPIQDTMYPAFSRIQDDTNRMAAVWLRVVRLVGALVAPSMLGLIVVAPDFVATVLGHRWLGSVRVVQILALVTLMMGFTAVGERALMALGRAGLILRISALRTALAVCAFAAGLHWGIVGIAAFYAGASIPVQAYLVFVATRALQIPQRAFLRNLAGVIQAAAGMFVVCLAVRVLLVSYGVSAGIRLAVLVAVGAAAYGVAIAWRDPEVVSEARRLAPRSGRRRLRRAARVAEQA